MVDKRKEEGEGGGLQHGYAALSRDASGRVICRAPLNDPVYAIKGIAAPL